MNCFEICSIQSVSFWKKSFKCIRLRFQTFTKCQTLNKKFATQQILNENFKTCQDLKKIICNVSDFELKTLKRERYWKICIQKKLQIESCYSEKTACSAFFLLFRKTWFRNKKIKTSWCFELKKSRTVYFDAEKYQSVRFWILKNITRYVLKKLFTTCRNSIDKFNNASVFELDNLLFF